MPREHSIRQPGANRSGPGPASIRTPAGEIATEQPSLAVVDITAAVRSAIKASAAGSGVAFVSAPARGSMIRVRERDEGTLLDFEALLAQLVPPGSRDRERLLCLLLGRSSAALPFRQRRLALGPDQRVLLIGTNGSCRRHWTLTVIGR